MALLPFLLTMVSAFLPNGNSMLYNYVELGGGLSPLGAHVQLGASKNFSFIFQRLISLYRAPGPCRN